MKVILTEKPSVAKDIAKGIGSYSQNKEHIRAGEYVIVWAMGHLLEIDDSVAPEKWDIESLPIFPERFLYKAKNPHFFTVKKILSQARGVIVATDAGREGELIARLILLHSGWKNWDRTYRLWTSKALTPEVVRKELKALKPIKEFDSLYWSAIARQHADWLVGINLTRAVSLKAKNGVWSVGRVQTPTLALIVKRTIERENFKPQPYFVTKGVFSKDGKVYEGLLVLKGEEGKLSEEKAKQILKELEKESTGEVAGFQEERKKEYAPHLFSLTSLQRRANEKFGWSASKTLRVAQKLYEELKCISYPRTDAQHLSEENKELVKEVLKKLGREDLVENVDKVGKRVFDDSKLTDHHAIIPLDRLPKEADEDDRKLYELIKSRFFAVFMPAFEYLSFKVITKLGKYEFVSYGRKVLALGWREVEPLEETQPDLSFLRKGDRVKKEKVLAQKKWTEPPPAYTEGSLLKEMERLSLGTPATRASIIETLKERGYVFLKGKSLIATEKGKALIKFLEGRKIIQPEMTSEWEKKLESIYTQKQGKRGYEEFLEGIKGFVQEELQLYLSKNIHVPTEKLTPEKVSKPKPKRKQTNKQRKG
jgi:DNA topoisomerase-3